MFRKTLPLQYKSYLKTALAAKEKSIGKVYQKVLRNTMSLRNATVEQTRIFSSPSINDHLKDADSRCKAPEQSDMSLLYKKLSQIRISARDRLQAAKTIKSHTNLEKLHNTSLYKTLSQVKASVNDRLQGISARNIALGATVGLSLAEDASPVQSQAEIISEASETPAVATAAAAKPELIFEPIPEPPPVFEGFQEAATQLNALGEPTFASLGLGGWTPVGWIQTCLEYCHVTLGIPWWESIMIGTIIVRVLMFPLVVIAQRNAAKMNNYLPQLQALQLKMTEARQTGNQLELARLSQEMVIFMKDKNLNPLKNMIVPLAQMPLFISFFMGLRQMANLPVDSLRQGGMLWFTDLTLPDQYFALPILTSFTLWVTIELGTDSAKLSSQNMQIMKYVLRALPVMIFPFTVNFPGAILCYWVSSNFISLLQVGFLRIPAVRDYFKIEPQIKHDLHSLPIKNKGFIGGIKDSWENVKITKELEDRKRYDDMQFQRAGRGPVVKTYKYDPTKQMKPNAISAKKRD